MEKLNMPEFDDEPMDDELTEDCVFVRDSEGNIVRLEVPDDAQDN